MLKLWPDDSNKPSLWVLLTSPIRVVIMIAASLFGCVSTSEPVTYQAHWTSSVVDQRAGARTPEIWNAETVTIDQDFTLTWEQNDDGILDYGRDGEFGSIVLPDKIDDVGVRKSFTLYPTKEFDGFVGATTWELPDGEIIPATVTIRY